MVGIRKDIATIGPDVAPVRSFAQLPNNSHFPAASAYITISSIPPTASTMKNTVANTPSTMSMPFTTSVYTTDNIPASAV